MNLHLDPFVLYNAVMGMLAAVGLLYVLYTQQFAPEYRRCLFVTMAGLMTFAVVSPAFEMLFPSFVHVVHGVSALLVVLGLYDPVSNDLRKDEWAALLLKEPKEMRHPAEWMVPADDRILEVFHSSELVLTPAIIAYNIDYSREEVNRRLSELGDAGLVERVERGKYRLTDLGEKYLRGSLHVALLEMGEAS